LDPEIGEFVEAMSVNFRKMLKTLPSIYAISSD